MSSSNMLMHELELSVSEHFDPMWLFCKSFGFKLETNMEEHMSIILFSMKPDCSIIETTLRSRDTLLAFFANPTPYLIVSMLHHELDIANINLASGESILLRDVTPEHNFHMKLSDEKGEAYCLSELLSKQPCYRVAWALHIIQGRYEKDRDYDSCLEMYDGRLVADSIDYLRMSAIKPTMKNINKAIAESSQNNVLSG